jgi:hypothetical protein
LHLHRNGSGRPADQAHHGSDNEWCHFQVHQGSLRSGSARCYLPRAPHSNVELCVRFPTDRKQRGRQLRRLKGGGIAQGIRLACEPNPHSFQPTRRRGHRLKEGTVPIGPARARSGSVPGLDQGPQSRQHRGAAGTQREVEQVSSIRWYIRPNVWIVTLGR